MLKKVFLSAVLALSVIAFVPAKAYTAYANGASIGVALMGGFPANAAIGLTGKFNGVPLVFGASARFVFANNNNSYFGAGVTMDWWGLQIPLAQGDVGIHFYLGPGAAVDVDFASNYWDLSVAFRVPIGFSFVFSKQWELYLELAPSISVLDAGSYGVQVLGFYAGNGSAGWGHYGFFGFAGQIGFRYWF